MVKGWNTSLSVDFIHGTFINVMLKSYLVLHVRCDYTCATNEKFSCSSHLWLFYKFKIEVENWGFSNSDLVNKNL
jgi:hypothetical protein